LGQAAYGQRVDSPPGLTSAGLARTDRYGDGLPPGAIARIGTVRFRHFGGFESLLISLDGTRVYALGKGTPIRCWDCSSGKELQCLGNADEDYQSMALSPDGKTLATDGWHSGVGHVVRLWDAESGTELHELAVPDAPVNALAFSQDGKMLAAGSGTAAIYERQKGQATERTVGGLATVWDLTSRKELCRIVVQPGPVASISFTADGKTLISTSRFDAQRLRFWDVPTGKGVRSLVGQPRSNLPPVFTPDGKTLASTIENHDEVIALWQTSTGTEVHRLLGHKEKVRALALSADGKLLASGGGDPAVRLWDVGTGKELRQFPRQPLGVSALAFSVDGSVLASGGADGILRIWRTASAKPLQPPVEDLSSVAAVAFAPGGGTLTTGSSDGSVRLWDSATGLEHRRLDGQPDCAKSIAWSPDGHLLAASGPGRTIRLWEMPSGRAVRPLDGAADGISSMMFSPDGKLLASADSRSVCIWEVATRTLLQRFLGNVGSSLSIAFSPDGKLLASAGKDSILRLWEVATGKELFESPDSSIEAAEPGREGCLAFSPDGKTLAVGGKSKTIWLYEVSTAKERGRFETFGNCIRGLAFTPDGELLASATENNSVVLWQMRMGRPIYQFPGHQAQGPVPEFQQRAINAVAFSPDGKQLASASADTTVLVWDMTRVKVHAGLLQQALAATELKSLWGQLANEHAMEACKAMRKFVSAPGQSVAFLDEQLQPVSFSHVEDLVLNLDSDRFPVRAQASKELETLGQEAEPVLLRVLKDNPSLEVRRRVDQLLARIQRPAPPRGRSSERRPPPPPDEIIFRPEGRVPPPQQLRVLRALEILERIGTREARRLLAKMAGGAPIARATQEAKACLERLEKQAQSQP